MPNVLEGTLLAGKVKVAIVVSRFNELVTERLLAGAIDTFRRHGLPDDAVTVNRLSWAWRNTGLSVRASTTAAMRRII